MMAKCIVTGGAGFIGSNLCEELIKKGHEVTAIDNLSVSDINVARLKQIGVELAVADIADYDSIEYLFKGADFVFHLAAMNRAQRSIEEPVKAHHANITGALHVLEAMRKHGVKKIIFSSSSSVYAGRSGLLREEDPLSPPHPYGVGKLACEHYIRIYQELYGIKGVILRFFSVYGPRQLGTIDKAGVVAKFIHKARNNKPLTIYGGGEQKRNFTYVGDVIRCLIIAGNNERAEGEIINIANPDEITINKLAQQVIALTGTKSIIEHYPPLPGDPDRNAADVKKAQQILNYYPKVSFEEGIIKTMEWYDETFR